MKKACLIIPLLLVLLISCTKEKPLRIGVSQCSQDDWRSKMNSEMERELLFHPEAQIEIRSADNDNGKQIKDIRYFLEEGFDIILAAPNEAEAVAPIIKEVYEKGVPIVVFDRTISGDSYTAYVDANNLGIGRSAARYAEHLLPNGGSIWEIKGLKGSSPGRERHEGFVEELSGKSSYRIEDNAYGDWDRDRAESVVDSLLGIHGRVDLIYAHKDRMALGAAAALKRKGINGTKIIGVDAVPQTGIQAVEDGDIDATFLYPTEGHFMIRLALQILSGAPFEKVITLPVSSAVDASNADILLRQNQSLEEETAKMKLLKSQVDEYWSKHSAQTSLFYATIIILILFTCLIFILLRAYWQHRRHQRELLEQNALLEQQRDIQRELNEKLTQATKSKLAFFTNVSHDLKTPLTLIAEPVEELGEAKNLTDREKTLASIASRNVKILKRLISEILDFRKYESGKLEIHLCEVDLSEKLSEWSDSFRSLARDRDINLELNIEPEVKLALDAEKMERICYNLLSNAFKYTPDNGTITLGLESKKDEIIFYVQDSGIGIKSGDLGKIFDNFYQVESINPNGSGIGLALVKAFVEQHSGNISVESEFGKGSKFIVRLPLRHCAEALPKSDRTIQRTEPRSSSTSSILSKIEAPEVQFAEDKPIMLVIDDNEDLRTLMSELMKDDYNILLASNGAEGIKTASRYIPDLIVCDVMMPVMDGFECCRRLKGELSTSHIPILLLTACSTDEQKVQGFECDADAFVSKPFSAQVLKSQCRSLLENRKRIKDLYRSPISLGEDIANRPTSATPEGSPTGLDNEFYAKLLQILRSEMKDPELNVDALASKMNLGRSQFYRKVKALTNYSPVELLRSLRLRQARKLLSSSEMSVSEIAYEVGFSSPAYFTKCYREAFGEVPSKLRA